MKVHAMNGCVQIVQHEAPPHPTLPLHTKRVKCMHGRTMIIVYARAARLLRTVITTRVINNY